MNVIERELLAKAQKYYEVSDLYRRKYRSVPHGFSEIPILRKKDLLDDQELCPPFGSNVIVPFDQISRVHRTSGTSTKPLLLTLTGNDVSNVISTGCKAFRNVGLTKDDIVINCMNYCMWMGGFMDHQSLEATGATVIPYGVGHTDNLVELLHSIKNVCIHSTPSYLSVIEKIARENHQWDPKDLMIKKALLGGEGGASNYEYRKKIENTFGTRIYDANYGMSEVMSIIASEHEGTDGLVFVAGETLYPELLQKNAERDETAANHNIVKGAVGELVLSNLDKQSQPLLRYSTGDIVEILEVEDEEPTTKFRFKVIGRSDDMIVVKGINFYPASIRDIVSKCSIGTGNYKIRIPDKVTVDYVKLLIEVREFKSSEEMDIIRKNVISDIRRKHFVLCDVEFVEQLNTGSNKVGLIERIDKDEH